MIKEYHYLKSKLREYATLSQHNVDDIAVPSEITPVSLDQHSKSKRGSNQMFQSNLTTYDSDYDSESEEMFMTNNGNESRGKWGQFSRRNNDKTTSAVVNTNHWSKPSNPTHHDLRPYTNARSSLQPNSTGYRQNSNSLQNQKQEGKYGTYDMRQGRNNYGREVNRPRDDHHQGQQTNQHRRPRRELSNDHQQNRDGRNPPRYFKKNLSEVKMDMVKIKEYLLRELKNGDNEAIKRTYDMIAELYHTNEDIGLEDNSESENEESRYFQMINKLSTENAIFALKTDMTSNQLKNAYDQNHSDDSEESDF
jgi:hypothetical protein